MSKLNDKKEPAKSRAVAALREIEEECSLPSAESLDDKFSTLDDELQDTAQHLMAITYFLRRAMMVTNDFNGFDGYDNGDGYALDKFQYLREEVHGAIKWLDAHVRKAGKDGKPFPLSKPDGAPEHDLLFFP